MKASAATLTRGAATLNVEFSTDSAAVLRILLAGEIPEVPAGDLDVRVLIRLRRHYYIETLLAAIAGVVAGFD